MRVRRVHSIQPSTSHRCPTVLAVPAVTFRHAERSQGRSLLCGIPCLLFPGAGAHASCDVASLRVLVEAAGGVVCSDPEDPRIPARPQTPADFVGKRPPVLLLLYSAGQRAGPSYQDDTHFVEEGGFGGLPLYSKEWLTRSVLTFQADWSAYYAVVPQSA
jgi:hypothetical protein